MDSMKTTICHFKEFLQDWDSNITNLEGMHAKGRLLEKIKYSINQINGVLSDAEEKVMKRHSSIENQGKALVDLHKTNFHKDLTEASSTLLHVLYEVERLYELQNRVISDNYKLRAQK